MGKEGNVGIKIKCISLLKKIKNKIIFSFQLDKKKPKNIKFFSFLKNQLRHMSIKFFL